MYSKCCLFLKGSPSSSCPLQLHKPVHLGQDTVPKILLYHVVVSLPSFYSRRSFFENAYSLGMITHFMKLLKSAVKKKLNK